MWNCPWGIKFNSVLFDSQLGVQNSKTVSFYCLQLPFFALLILHTLFFIESLPNFKWQCICTTQMRKKSFQDIFINKSKCNLSAGKRAWNLLFFCYTFIEKYFNFPIFNNVLVNLMTIYRYLNSISQDVCLSSPYLLKLGCTYG